MLIVCYEGCIIIINDVLVMFKHKVMFVIKLFLNLVNQFLINAQLKYNIMEITSNNLLIKEG